MGRDDGPLEMTTYTLTAPNGKTYDIEGPPGQSQDAVQAEILRRDPSAGDRSEGGIHRSWCRKGSR